MRFEKNDPSNAEEVVITFRMKQKYYRINLYLTTSVANVNGKGLNIFVNDHMPVSIRQTNKMGDFKVMNRIIKEQITSILSHDDENSIDISIRNGSCIGHD